MRQRFTDHVSGVATETRDATFGIHMLSITVSAGGLEFLFTTQ